MVLLNFSGSYTSRDCTSNVKLLLSCGNNLWHTLANKSIVQHGSSQIWTAAAHVVQRTPRPRVASALTRRAHSPWYGLTSFPTVVTPRFLMAEACGRPWATLQGTDRGGTQSPRRLFRVHYQFREQRSSPTRLAELATGSGEALGLAAKCVVLVMQQVVC